MVAGLHGVTGCEKALNLFFLGYGPWDIDRRRMSFTP